MTQDNKVRPLRLPQQYQELAIIANTLHRILSNTQKR